jgi:hypothetical protein
LGGITAFRNIHWQHYPYRAFGIGVWVCITIATTTREALCLNARLLEEVPASNTELKLNNHRKIFLLFQFLNRPYRLPGPSLSIADV